MCLTCLLGVDAWPDGISEVLKLSRKNSDAVYSGDFRVTRIIKVYD